MATAKPSNALERKQIWATAFGAKDTTLKKKAPDHKTQKSAPVKKNPVPPSDPAVRSFITNTLQQLQTMDPTPSPESRLAIKEKEKTLKLSKPSSIDKQVTKVTSPNPTSSAETPVPPTTEKIEHLIIKNIFAQINHLYYELSKYTQSTSINSTITQMKSTLVTMEQILLEGQDPLTPLPPLSASFSDVVNANIHKYQTFNMGTRKRARRESTEIQHITPVVIENYKTPDSPFITNLSISEEIQKHKPLIQLKKLIHMRNGNLLIFPKDIPSLNSLLSPWPEGAFNGAHFTCRLARKQGTETPSDPPVKVLVIKGININITETQIKVELENQGIQITRLHRIISRNTQQPTTFFKIHLTNPDQAAGLLHEGFYMDLFQYRVEKARPPPNIKQCFKCQQFNHISINCNNPVVCLRCGENHHHKTCTKEKRHAKCANCAGEHSAVSKTCPVYLSNMTQFANKPSPLGKSTNPSSLYSRDSTHLAHLRDDLKRLAMDDTKIEEVIKSIRKHTHHSL
ncbi:5-hydroxytryptamine receptor 3A-like [Solea senegalensis]|uniref:5-hydroxytryptamine receptor 3A-like n=1 Tax=Solea senegalensis TaxID=28829 RepID=A0AAV6PHJ6_SOLSE|nr:5-hydroxytryptamine receptor 3A-like [Solea senegalensis]